MQIIERRTYFSISDYNLRDSSSLESPLLIWEMGVKYPIDKVFLHNEKTSILTIPRGVGRDYVISRLKADAKYISDEDIIDEKDKYVEPRTTTFHLKKDIYTKDEIQENAITFLTNESAYQLMLALDVGFGKTFCSIISAYKLGLVPLVILRSNWMDQWVKEFKKYTDLDDEDFLSIVGSDMIERTMKKPAKHQVYIISIDTLVSYLEAGNSLDDFMTHIGVGIKIYDEAHKNFISIMKIDQNTNVKHTWYLTATPGRSSYSENKTYKIVFFDVERFGEHTSRLKQYYNIRELMYNTEPPYEEIQICSTPRGFSSIQYASYIFSNKKLVIFYLSLIISYTTKLIEADPDARALVLLDRLDDIAKMKRYLSARVNYSIGTYCGLIKNYDLREEELTKQIVLSTLGSVGVAKNIADLRLILPFANFSSPIIVRQLMGRLRYLEGKMVYYFNPVDTGFPAIIGQSKMRSRELRVRAHTYEEINISVDDEVKNFIENDLQACSDIPNTIPQKRPTKFFQLTHKKRPRTGFNKWRPK